MKNFLIFSVLVLSACEPSQKTKSQAEHYGLESPVQLPAAQTTTTASCNPRYALTVETRMHSVSLNPFKHMRNHLNANVFTIQVDEKTYNNTSIGKVLDKEFDGIGFVIKGNWQSVESVVIEKNKICM